jgi:predicted Fe-Mo cluster-binding NifX family protein
MRIAIPTWSERVSPVFDEARTVLLVDIEDGRETSRLETAFSEAESADRAAKLAGLGVACLICGAISQELEARVSQAGIEVIPHVCGPVNEVLGAYLRGAVQEPNFAMPGCRRCCRNRRGQGGRWRGGRR